MEKFKDNLIHLRVIIEEIEKINITERLETKKKKRNKKKRAERIRNDKNRSISRDRKKINKKKGK